jgi:hypothetical protein
MTLTANVPLVEALSGVAIMQDGKDFQDTKNLVVA